MHFTLPYNAIRFMGIIGLVLLLYILVIGVFGKIDITPLLPVKLAAAIQEGWPEMPFFTTAKEPLKVNGQQEIYYTVPTRQLTSQELARLLSPTSKAADSQDRRPK